MLRSNSGLPFCPSGLLRLSSLAVWGCHSRMTVRVVSPRLACFILDLQPKAPPEVNGGTMEKAAMIANHASTRTTQLYDRHSDEVSLDEIERILI